MKRKKLWLFFLLGLFFFLPKGVMAESTQKMYMDLTIREDGSILVREMDVLSGSYNGLRRVIQSRNTRNSSVSDWTPESSELYNGGNITNLVVGEIPGREDVNFSSFDAASTNFQEVTSASNGQSGVYTATRGNGFLELKIFNPSNRGTAFYLEYIVPDSVVVHEDVAELAWTLLDSYEEEIEDFQIRIHLPKEDPTMRIFAHGVLNGESKRDSDQQASLYVENLGAYNNTNFRMVFDKKLVPNATKQSGVYAMDSILSYEEEQAELANQEREKIRVWNSVLNIGSGVLVFLLVAVLIYVYFKYDREQKVDFDMEYYRDFPGTYGPEVLEYLLSKRVSEDGLTASILNLVEKKVLKLTPNEMDHRDGTFTYLPQENLVLSKSEQEVVQLLIHTIGNGTEVTLKQIKDYGKKEKNAEVLLEHYQDWQREARAISKEENFYLSIGSKRILPILLGMFTIFVGFLHFPFETMYIFGIVMIVIGFFAVFYAALFQKRTAKGALQYKQWMAFKKFLQDFSRFDEKELPEFSLWGKYLVYATVLGCAKELEKTMELRVPNIETNEDFSQNMFDFYLMRSMINLHVASSIQTTIHSAVASSRASIAASSSSSGGGFGGGFSSGGGGFGGGGGGGRF